MTASVLKFQRNGSPATLFENALAEAGEVEFALVVMLRKDGFVRTDWSFIESSMTALGCAELLKQRLMDEI